MTEEELVVDAVERLNRAGITYFLTGSMASNYWGIPRTTHDLDFVVQLARDSAASLLREFASDFYIDANAVDKAFNPPFQFNAIDMRSALKVDFWLLGDEPFARAMFDRRLHIDLFGQPTWIATAEDIILHKLYWNRITPSERQLNDAAGVVAVQTSALDTAYLRQWGKTLGVMTELDLLLSAKIKPKTT